VSRLLAGSERKYRRVRPPVFLKVKPDGVLVPRFEKWARTSLTVCRSSDHVGGLDTSIRDMTPLLESICFLLIFMSKYHKVLTSLKRWSKSSVI